MVGVTSEMDDKWSDKKMEGDEGFNTVECLRGRLLAERQASKVANEEAESICNRLIELEKKLREEIKLREKAERRLKYLRKKLESFSLSSISGESDESHSSQKCQIRFTTPTTSKTKPQTTNPPISHSSMHKFSEDYDSQGDPDYDFPQNLCEDPNPDSEDLKSDESRLSISSSKSSTKDSIALSTDDYSSNTTNPGDSSLEDHSHNPNPSSNNVKNKESKY